MQPLLSETNVKIKPEWSYIMMIIVVISVVYNYIIIVVISVVYNYIIIVVISVAAVYH